MERKRHYPILNDWAVLGIKPYCGQEGLVVFALTVAETTCEKCLRRIASAQNKVEVWRQEVWGE